MAKKLNILLLVPLLLVVNCHLTKKWHTSTLLVFDTVCEIKIFCSPSKFISAMKETKRIFSNIEDCFSPDSEDHSSLIVLDLFRRSSEVYQNSNGYFDITVGPLSRLWGFLDKSHSVP
ncbi:MAG: FAD:protein FMN transferase, partial [Candidatus Aminicenantaceae bacterium]